MKKKVLLFLIVVFVLAGGWIWRYDSLNQYYEMITNNAQEVHSIGDTIHFEQDYIDYGLEADGYSLRVDSFELIDFDEYICSQNIEPAQFDNRPNKVALVSITIMNDGSKADGVALAELELFGIDEWLPVNYELLDTLNPVLKGNLGISLAEGTEYQVVLPYGLYKNSFSSGTWNHLDEYNFFFQVTAYPTRKIVRMQ